MSDKAIMQHAVKITADISEFNSGIDKLVKKMSLTEKQAGQFANKMAKALDSSSPDTQRVGAAMDKLNEQYRKQNDQLTQYISKAGESGNILSQLTTQHQDEANAITKTLDSINTLKTAYEEANKVLKEIAGDQAKTLSQYNKELERTQEKIAKVEQELQPYYQQLEEIKASTDEALTRAKTDEQAQIELQIEQQMLASVNDKYDEKVRLLEELKQKYSDLQAISSQAQKVEEIGTALGNANLQLANQENQLAKTQSQMESYGETAETNMQRAYKEAEAMGRTASSMQSFISKAQSLTKVGSYFEMIGKSVTNVTSKMANLAAKGVKGLVSHFKSLISKSKEYHSQSGLLGNAIKKLSGSFNSFGNMLVRRFKRAIISEIFNSITDGIKQLAKESPAFNESISSVLGALQQFANQLIGIVAPIVQALSPILTTIVNMFTATAEKVAQFTALITGQNSYLQAAPVSYDFAKSLDSQTNSTEKTTKATEEATKAAEEYKRSLMGFDQLNILGSDDGENKLDSLGGSSEDASQVEIQPPKFKESSFKNVSGKLKDFVDKIKGCFDKKDWKGLGQAMADGVNSAFSWVGKVTNWENCGEKITEIINAITGTINGFVDGLDAKEIGSTIGGIVNTIVNTLTLLVTGINWQEIGGKFGETLKNIFTTVDWANLGALLIDGIQSALYLLQGFVSTPGLFEEAGTALADTLYGMIDELDPTAWGDTFAKLVNGIATMIKDTFADHEKFAELGSKLASNVNTAIYEIEPEEIADAINNFVQSMFDMILKFLEETDWEQLGKNVADFIYNIDWASAADKFFEAIGAAFGGILEFFKGLFSQPWEDFKNWFYDVAFDDGEFSIGGLLDGIINALANIGFWIEDHVLKPIWDGIKKVFGIADDNSNSTEMQPAGESIISGMLEGITNVIKGIGDWIKKHIFDPIMSGLETAFDFAGGVANSMVNFGSSIVDGICDGFTGITDKIGNALSGVQDALEGPFEAAKNAIGGIIDDIQNFDPWQAASDVGDWFKNGFKNFGDGVVNFFGLDGYANGGFPEDGLFMANHNELVGQFSNGKTAVANNSDIVAALKGGVQDAIAPFMLQLMRTITDTQTNGTSGEPVIEIDGEKLARIITRNQKKIYVRDHAFNEVY